MLGTRDLEGTSGEGRGNRAGERQGVKQIKGGVGEMRKIKKREKSKTEQQRRKSSTKRSR